MTKATVDLTNCDREPIDLLGTIQPVGFLLVLTLDSIVARGSLNVPQYLVWIETSLIGLPLDEVAA